MVSPLAKQTWMVMGVLLNMLGQGMLLSFTSIMLPAILAPDSDIPVDLYTASWIASVIGTAGIPGFMLSSLLMELFGRKLAHGVVLLPGILGWLCVYFARSVPLLIIGRTLGGISAAATVSLGAVVIGEYTCPKNRGMFLNLKTAAVCLGNMLVHILGHFYNWRTVALMALAPLMISLVIICTWPESPAWLASKKKYEKSEKSFYWLRGKSAESVNEIEDLLKAQKQRFSTQNTNTTCITRVLDLLQIVTKKDFIKPVIIVIFSGILLEACGRHIFPAYALQIIEEVTGNKADSFYYTLGIDIIITASAVSSSVLVKLLKRRTLLFTSGFAALFFLYAVCLYLYLVSINVISSERVFIPITLFIIYFILSNLGCTPIPLALLGEIFPLPHRGIGTSTAGLILSLCIMSGMQVTPYLLVSIKVHGTFAVLGTVMGVALIALFFILPETKDKTLQEIEDYFNNGEVKRVKNYNDDAKLKMLSNKDYTS